MTPFNLTRYSTGTALAVSSSPLPPDRCHHFWELKLTRAVYGSSIMAGLVAAGGDVLCGDGDDDGAIRKGFKDVIGRDNKSWG